VPDPLIVLLASDDAELTRTIGRRLRDQGHTLLTFRHETAPAALVQYPWQILIVDGAERSAGLCRLVKRDPAMAERHIIALTETAEQGIQMLDAGADDFQSLPITSAELLARLGAAARIVSLKGNLIVVNRQLELLTITDGLTGLFTHSYIHAEVNRALASAQHHEEKLSLAMLDLDGFKSLNDKHGHPAGDHVLIEVSTILAGSVRASDCAARYGGDEFALLLRDTTMTEAVAIAERIRRNVEDCLFEFGSDQIRATISIGVADPAIGGSSSQLFRSADAALYRAKRSGKNQVCSAGTSSRRRDSQGSRKHSSPA
jgi:two-component system, cell cycle response regulator